MTPPSSKSRYDLILAALLVSATWTVYAPALRGEFVWDDNEYVRDNPVLRSADGLRQIWLEPLATPQFHPLVFTTYWLEYRLWGLDPTGYHVTNIALHTANTLLLWLLLRRMRVPGAAFAAALFALHPVHVESVAWVTERKDTLSVFFYLLAMLAWVRFLETRSAHTYALTVAFFVGTMLSKTVLCTFPIAALLVAAWKEPRAWRERVPAIAPLLGMSLLFGGLTMWREYQHGNPPLMLTSVERIVIAGRALWFYVWKLLWPGNLTAIYPQWSIDAASFVFPLAAIAAMVGLWMGRQRFGLAPFLAVGFFILTLAPMLGFIDNNFMRLSYVADHFVYLASCGLIALFAAGAAAMNVQTTDARRAVGYGLGALLLLALGVLTWRQAGVYANAETFWRDNITKNPASWMGHDLLAAALAKQGQIDAALEQFAAAVAAKPDYTTARNHWGIVLDAIGQADAALEQYAAALAIDPTLADVHNNVGTILYRQGQLDAAREHFRAAVRLEPDYAEAHNHLGMVAATTGRRDAAVAHFREALRLKPDYPGAQANLDRALAGGNDQTAGQ